MRLRPLGDVPPLCEPFVHAEHAELAELAGEESRCKRELEASLRLFQATGAKGHAARIRKARQAATPP